MERQEGICAGVDERQEGQVELAATLERLAGAAALLEQAVERLAEKQSLMAADAEACIGRVVATVEARRETELEQKLAAAEAVIAELRASFAATGVATQAGPLPTGRKTVPPAMANLLAKQGVTVESMEAGALDAALVSLSVEQRIAVKARLMRAGLLS